MIENVPSIEVTEWSSDFLRTVVRIVTDSSFDFQVDSKDHILYLGSYLNNLDVKTVVLEGNYIDQNYLEDYQDYYSSCFPHHPKCCTRLHFFSNSFKESDFLNYIKSNSPVKFERDLQKNYLGFIVIRPIPDTFIAKLCLKSYPRTENTSYKLIKKVNVVNLFGVRLEINSAPFTEKDRVVSACATSSIWMLLNSSAHYDRNSYPSPSGITKIALNGSNSGTKGFPVLGLNPEQVCRTIQNYGLEAKEEELYQVDFKDNFNKLKSCSVAYISNDIPFILAGVVYKNIKDGENLEYVGEHALCVLGYRYLDKSSLTGINKDKSSQISKLYAHDDRYGPYLALEFSGKSYAVITKENHIEEAHGLKISFDKLHSKGCDFVELFVPDRIIIAKHHKARIPLDDIVELIEHFIYMIKFLSTGYTFIKPNNLNYEIKLTSSNKLKELIKQRKCKFFSFNSIRDKSSFLCRSLPKHIWLCSIYDGVMQLGEIVFDATEILQGRPLIGYIAYQTKFDEIWKNLSKKETVSYLYDQFNSIKDIHPREINNLKVYSKFLRKTDELLLNGIYGEPKLVHRKFKVENILTPEVNSTGEIKVKPEVKIIKYESTWKPSDLVPSSLYIWLIDVDGDMYYGVENETDKNLCTGHPTLNSARPARLAGELNFDPDKCKWIINLKSSAYSKHISSEEDQQDRLEAVFRHNFVGWEKSDLPIIKTYKV